MNGLIIFWLCLVIYMGNGKVPYNPDFLVHGQLGDRFWRYASLELNPDDTPGNFYWMFRDGQSRTPVWIEEWDDNLLDLRDQGIIEFESYQYFVAKTVREGSFVNTWGPSVGIMTSPLFAAWNFWVRSTIEFPQDLWLLGKIIASVCVAASAVFIYYTAILFRPRFDAWIVTIAYSFGTSVWSVSSQNLWQHSLVELFLAAGIYFFCLDRRYSSPLLSSILFSLAICCRPTNAMFVIAAGTDYLLRDRLKLTIFLLSGIPFALFLLAHNYHFFGSPFLFGQTPIDHPEVIAMGGAGSVWQTPVWYGLAAHLFSPSRGIFVFSPFLLFSLWGCLYIWKDESFKRMRFLIFTVGFILYVQSRFVDWWGGYSFGYRHIVDSIPALSLMLLPVIGVVWKDFWKRCVFIGLLFWSIGVQIIGVGLYDITGWNARAGLVYRSQSPKDPPYELDLRALPSLIESEKDVSIALLSIDDPVYRHRLWSVFDNQLLYYLENPSDARFRRAFWNRRQQRSRGEILAESHLQIGNAYRLLGRNQLAATQYHLAAPAATELAEIGLCLVATPIDRPKLIDRVEQIRCTRDIDLLCEAGLMLLDTHPVEALSLLERSIRLNPIRSLVSFPFPHLTFSPPMMSLFTGPALSDRQERMNRTSQLLLVLSAGWKSMNDGSASVAERLFQRAAEIDTGQPWAFLRLGEMQADAGRWDEANENLTKAIDRGLWGSDAHRAKSLLTLVKSKAAASSTGIRDVQVP
jgi:tetratricopeptide (TPR) repeat protein